MAKIPFGDPSSEPSIDCHANPVPLLAEVAECALAAVPMRPALAVWFYRAWTDGRILVKKVRGKKSPDSLDKRAAMLLTLQSHRGPGIEQRIQQLRVELRVEASVETVHGWRRDLRKTLDADRAAEVAAQAKFAVDLFVDLSKRGVIGPAAAAAVRNALDVSVVDPGDELLEHWQWEAEHSGHQ